MKVLQIAYYYPPMGGAGVQRALKFSKYLGGFGITPVVLAAADPHYVHDASLGDEVPAGLEVHRVPHTPWLGAVLGAVASRRRGAGLGGALGGELGGALGGGDAGSEGAAGAGAAGAAGGAGDAAEAGGAGCAGRAAGTSAGGRSGARTRADTAAGTAQRTPKAALRDAALAAWQALQWPDEMAGWARRAAPLARRLVADSRRSDDPIRLVFSSSPPISAHTLGQAVAQSFGLPWVADMRDLWTDNPAYAAPRWRALLDRRREDALLARAAGIVSVTRTWADLLAQRAPVGTPVAFIPNGYDESDFTAAPGERRGDGLFRLTHTGTFYGPRSPAPLLEGLGRLLQADAALALRFRLRLVGNVGARFEPALGAFAARHPGVLERVSYVPHAQAIAEMTAADALLMVVGGSAAASAAAGWLPGKLFEYLRARRPILLLGAPHGEAAAIVREAGAGLSVDESDPAAIAAALARLVAGEVRLPAGGASIDAYERRALAGRLAGFFRQITAHG